MALFTAGEAALAGALRNLALSNPFLPDRLAAERAVLGDDYEELQPVWSTTADLPELTSNVIEIALRAEALAATVRERLAAGEAPEPKAFRLYEDVALYVLYERFREDYRRRARKGDWGKMWEVFRRDARELLPVIGARRDHPLDPLHLFSFFFQIRQAFTHIFDHLVGASMVVAHLRAAVWESIFTHDLYRYQRVLYDRMGDLNTLVTGPSGTGKELVARAIGLSRYIPFDPKSGEFKGEIAGEFHAVNLSSLSPTLIESELFGHRKGAFTGALANRAGWFEVCSASGAVFLDEIGETPTDIQVKLLRVLEERTFVPLGDSVSRQFDGKIIAATNRDLASEMQEGRFREDLYYRLCADVIRTPALSEQLAEAPEELATLVRFLAVRLMGESDELDAFVAEATAWILKNLGADYAWPGNVRELEQCVRNLLLRQAYRPLVAPRPTDPEAALVAGIRGRSITAEELLTGYVTLVYQRTGTYEAAARRLGLDRRTVKAKVDPALLDRVATRR